MTLADCLAAIAAAPEGPGIGAFFDFDGTIIDGFSARTLLHDRGRRRDIGVGEGLDLLFTGVKTAMGAADFNSFMSVGVRHLAGRPAAELDLLGERLTRSAIGGALQRDALALIEAHQARGHTLAIATSALPYQVESLARELGIDTVLCTRPRVVHGVLDGTIDGDILWGPGKAAAVAALAADRGIDLEASFGYGNGAEDVQFLATVGRPCAVNPHSELASVAGVSGWPTLAIEAPARGGLTAGVRTVAAYAGMASAFGVGIGLGLLNGSRRDAVNLSASIGSDVALSLAGVHVDVAGARHLWAERPAVFIFNHQSWLDGLVAMKLLRGDITGVAKKEVASQPGFGQFARLANMAFVDRSDGKSARKALEPAVQRLREGYSIVIAPEGTRSTTPRVGPFKKGAFHLAMQGGVPIVPIVLRNAGDLLWRGSTVIQPGTVDVIVHAPISVETWNTRALGERVEQVRGLFVDTLAHWDATKTVVG